MACKGSVQAPEVHRHQFANARLLHGNPVNNIYSAHCCFIMGNNNKLGIVTKLADHVSELSNVGIVKRGIHLIENTERRRFDQVDREEKGGGCERTFAPAQLSDTTGPLTF